MENLKDILKQPKTALIEILTGTMYAGKTTYLTMEALGFNGKVLVLDFFNTRNSERELRAMIGKVSPVQDKIVYCSGFEAAYDEIEPGCLIIIDETHFAGIYGKTKEMRDFILISSRRASKIIVSGLLTDCYDEYRIFKIWNEIFPLADKFKFQHPVPKKCSLCGSSSFVDFTAPDKDSEEYKQGKKAGNHYHNICVLCKDNDI